MTFTIMAICRRTNRMGVAQSTSTPCVGQRCTEFSLGRGVVTLQAVADRSRLVKMVRDVDAGNSPSQIIHRLSEQDPYFAHRQVAILLLDGQSAAHTGSQALAWAGEIVKADHIVAANYMVGPEVVRDMSASFEDTASLDLEDSLMTALEAGRDAGGEPCGQRSAALIVYDAKYDFPLINLRVDVSEEPVRDLRKNFDWFKPLVPYYVSRTLDPENAPWLSDYLRKHDLPARP